jgi:hypothetical protein
MRTLRVLALGLTILLALSARQARAQQGRISGTVTNQHAAPPVFTQTLTGYMPIK